MLKADQRQEEASGGNEPSSSGNNGLWKRLWRLKVPPKIHIFWWQAMNNFLPTKMELHRRHVESEAFCATCGDEGESLFHVAFECSMARRFWQAAKELIGVKVPVLHPVTWTRDLLTGEHCSGQDAELIICGVWSLWSGRNARKHGN